jgi:hypothetical protein
MLCFSVSNDGMKVVNPMETIPEGAEPEVASFYNNNSALNINLSQNIPSSFGSPPKARKLPNLLISGLRSPFHNSKASLDGLKVGSYNEKELRLNQQLNGIGLTSKTFRQSYLEDWLSEQGSTVGGAKSPHGNCGDSNKGDNSVPNTPCVDHLSLFKMELEDETQKNTHPLHKGLIQNIPNRDVERIKHESILVEQLRAPPTLTVQPPSPVGTPAVEHVQIKPQLKRFHSTDDAKLPLIKEVTFYDDQMC